MNPSQHAEQLAKKVESAPCEGPCHHTRCQAARLMTAMAKVETLTRARDTAKTTSICSGLHSDDRSCPVHQYDRDIAQARLELDALVKPSPPPPRY